MPLTVSRTIEITPRTKVGRNDPCPCGSGKKYKKCHLLKDESYSPAVKSGVTTKVSEWLLKQNEFGNLLKNEVDKIFGDSPTTIEEVAPIMESLIYEGKMGKVSPLDYFLENADLTPPEKEYYQGWKTRSFFSFFKVLTVQLGHSVKLQDLINNNIYLVREKLATYQLQEGHFLATRIIPLNEEFAFSGAMLLPLPKEMAYDLERNQFSRLPGKLSQLETVRAVYSSRGKSEVKIKQELVEKLAKYHSGITLDEVEKAIDSPAKNISTLVKKINQTEILDLVTKLNNLRSESKVKEEERPGPMERLLTGQFMQEMSKKDFGSLEQKERDKIIRQAAEKWFNQAQKELQDKTPKDIILLERESLGNPHRELSYKFSLTPITSFGTDFEPNEYNFAVKNMQEGKYKEALNQFIKTKAEMTKAPDSFRWYNNVGTCLANLGEVSLAQKYFQKSLTLNPDYEVAVKNLRTFSDEKLIKKLTTAGLTSLFNDFSETDFTPIFSWSETANWQADFLTFLDYVKSHSVTFSPKWGLIPFRQVLEINKHLLIPDPETNFSAEWQFSKVRFLHQISLLAGFVKKRGRRLQMTYKGEVLIKRPPAEQFGFLLYFWLQKIDWASLQSGGWQSNFLEQANEVIQASSYILIKSLTDNFTDKGFTAQDLVKTSFPDIKGDRELFEITTSLAVERTFLFYLVWAGLLQQKNQFLLGSHYRVTPFGRKLLDQIVSCLHSTVPVSLREI